MDHATEVSRRLKRYAQVLTESASQVMDDASLEEWLGFWDDDDSIYGNARNLEYWLAQAAKQTRWTARQQTNA